MRWMSLIEPGPFSRLTLLLEAGEKLLGSKTDLLRMRSVSILIEP